MPLVKRIILSLGVIYLSACQAPPETPPPQASWQSQLYQDHPLVGQIWDTRLARWVDEATLSASLTQFQFILLGEIHDNPDHHRLQAFLIQQLAAQQRRPAVIMEMLQPEQATWFAQLNRSEQPPNWDDVAEQLNWAASGWPPWALYQPIFASLWQAGLPLAAGSLPREGVKQLVQDGEWQTFNSQTLGLNHPLPQGLEEGLKQTLIESHCGYFPQQHAEHLIKIQRARDALLADAMLNPKWESGALLIAGAGHVREDRAVPYYLRQHLGAASIATLSFVEVSADQPTLEDYFTDAELAPTSAIYDYIWFTPKTDEIDHCAELRQQLAAPPETTAAPE